MNKHESSELHPNVDTDERMLIQMRTPKKPKETRSLFEEEEDRSIALEQRTTSTASTSRSAS